MAKGLTFQRSEKKYLLDDDQYRTLRELLAPRMDEDAYGEYTVCNLYFDTEHNDLIRRSIEKPQYKEKMRLRSYGTVSGDDKVFLEIKKKYKKLVNKRRTKIVLADAYEYLETKELPEVQPFMNRQVLREIDYMLHRMELAPKVFLSYDRCAMFGRDNKDFRVTFDRNITTRRYDLGLHYGVYGDKLLEEDEWIMEIKIDQAMPLWMTGILSEHEIYPASFSKYGTEYKNKILSEIRN